jgi:hypothetical protein
MRFAGELALIGAAGSGAALAADQLAHDEMDRLAQGSKDFRAAVAAQPEELVMAYEQVFSQGEMSMMDRVVAAGILDGQMLPADGEVQADSPAGKKGIELAMQIRQARPDLAASLATLAAKDIDLMARQSEKGVTTMDVISAGEMGSGVSPIPAVLAGAGVGGGTAALAALMRKRGGGGDPFQVRRAGS